MHSMTGFGRAEYATDSLTARVEASSVNRKQGEVIIQIPRSYSELEAKIRQYVLSQLSRGRVNLAINLEKPEGVSKGIRINTGRAQALEAAFTELSTALDRPVLPTSADFLRTPEVIEFNDEPVEADEALNTIMPALENALAQMIKMRATEGQHLLDDTVSRISTLEKLAEQINDYAPSVKERHREQLQKRLVEAGLEIALDDERILKEVGLFADRSDITEEIIRLRSHFEKFREYLGQNEPVGRPLDFLCQELNREFNTIGSKANDATLAQLIVNAKTELEKIREQIQNVE